ncbi:EexN family lipoprotein [Bartonella sp. MM73XJBT]|uniref:EexN family lipoprotein n=1 Tax=Bartonella sp. MM73XJBT TaxID=3019095 RepID=UPI00235E4B4B|nr:EexN family lipoprotein [Bartonella sp. MM73XJBT]
MNKIIITALLLCTGFAVAGCEKTYSVEEFKKDPKLLNQWLEKCFIEGNFDSKNCKNAEQAEFETRKKWGSFGSGKDDEKKMKEKKESN